jgi:hypothetical protein
MPSLLGLLIPTSFSTALSESLFGKLYFGKWVFGVCKLGRSSRRNWVVKRLSGLGKEGEGAIEV